MKPNGALHNFKIFDITTSNGSNGSLIEDVVDSSEDMVESILASLNQPKTQKSIASFLLYDELGLQLFDEITRQDEYYLTNAERTILIHHADELANRVTDGSSIVELGSG